MRPEIKICGNNDSAFAVGAARLGVDYLGFIFHPSSPRHVTAQTAADIVATVREAVPVVPRFVGVFVTQDVPEIRRVMQMAALDIVQLHRRATATDVNALQKFGYEVWTLAGGACGDGVLFDSSHGDGETDFRSGPYKSILAGKISASNVRDACAYRPDVLDINSSLEISPGVKDLSRLRALLAEMI